MTTKNHSVRLSCHLKRRVSRSFAAMCVAVGITAMAGAVAPARAGNIFTINQFAKLLAADGEAGDELGRNVAISGDTAVVGAPFHHNDNAVASGAAYIFKRDANGVWTFQDKLLADDGEDLDFFGSSVAINGETIVVGADLDDDNGDASGSAYVFVRDIDTGIWTQQTKILASDGTTLDHFGDSVAISDNTIVVGASFDNDNGALSGSAYVFVRDPLDGTWTQQGSKILPNDGAAGDFFGGSVAIDEDTVIVGAKGDSDNGFDSGSAYTFFRTPDGMGGVVWNQEAKLLAFDGAPIDQFGNAVAIEGDTALVGAPLEGNGNGSAAGSAAVFVRTGAVGAGPVWTQQAKLIAVGGAQGDNLGSSVSLSGDTAVLGAPGDDDNGSGSGSASVFTRDANGLWTNEAKLVPSDGAEVDQFGSSVAISGATVIAGAPLDDEVCPGDINCNSGSAYIFELPAQGSPADLNGDGVVDGADLAILLIQWGTNGAADLNNDGVVNGADLAILLINWG